MSSLWKNTILWRKYNSMESLMVFKDVKRNTVLIQMYYWLKYDLMPCECPLLLLKHILVVCSHAAVKITAFWGFFVFACIWSFLPFSSFASRSCGQGRAWRNAGTNPRSLCDSGRTAQPGPAGWDLRHHADGQAEVWRSPRHRNNVVTPAFPGHSGKEACSHQNWGTGQSQQLLPFQIFWCVCTNFNHWK